MVIEVSATLVATTILSSEEVAKNPLLVARRHSAEKRQHQSVEVALFFEPLDRFPDVTLVGMKMRMSPLLPGPDLRMAAAETGLIDWRDVFGLILRHLDRPITGPRPIGPSRNLDYGSPPLNAAETFPGRLSPK